MVTDPTSSKYLSQFYDMSADATEIVNSLNEYKRTAQVGKIEQMLNKDETLKALQVHQMTSTPRESISAIRQQINTLKHLEDTPDNRQTIQELKKMENDVAKNTVQAINEYK